MHYPFPEGFLTSCTFDYITEDSSTKSFVASIFFFAYCIPASVIFVCYSQIFSHVSAHEKAMRAQVSIWRGTKCPSIKRVIQLGGVLNLW